MNVTGLIPVFNHPDAAVAKAVLDASYAAGIRVFEFTNRDSTAQEVFAALHAHAKAYPDLVLGVGTIFTKEDAKRFHELGAQFVVSPAFIPEVGRYCNDRELPWIPGCGTVTEMYNAVQQGATVIKVFPGNVLGPAFVKSARAVFPHIPIMPTGGVAPTTTNLEAWFEAGVNCVGMGSKLFRKELIASGDFEQLSNEIKNALSIIKQLR